jgi:hypothetical protein
VERAAHGPTAGTTSEHERAVDVEEEDVRQTGSVFSANVCRAGAFG